jgi:UDP-N-acetylmuramyl pentapeptide phosphotransferase/UDP-N-acetylglucosamine-1-phosphate transferase
LLATQGEIFEIDWFIIVFAAVMMFCLINLALTPIKPVFLGDSGSLLLGFCLAWLLIYVTQKPVSLLHPVAALWCVTIPVFDTLVVIVRRLKSKRSPFLPDRYHIHHLMVDSGIKPKLTLAWLLVLSAVTNALGIWLTYATTATISLLAYAALSVVFGYVCLHPNFIITLVLKLKLTH